MPIHKEIRKAIKQELLELLGEGCVLTAADVTEIGHNYGFKSRRNLWYLGVDLGVVSELPDLNFGEFKLRERHLVGSRTPKAFLEKVLGTWIIRSADIPIGETEFERVAQEIRDRRQRPLVTTRPVA